MNLTWRNVCFVRFTHLCSVQASDDSAWSSRHLCTSTDNCHCIGVGRVARFQDTALAATVCAELEVRMSEQPDERGQGEEGVDGN